MAGEKVSLVPKEYWRETTGKVPVAPKRKGMRRNLKKTGKAEALTFL